MSGFWNDTVALSSKTDQWETPQDLFDTLDKKFNFNLDPCADLSNFKCDKYFTEQIDGLKQSWAGHTVFMNPPYDREIKYWLKKAYEESKNDTLIVSLIPARTDTSYWHDYIFDKAEVYFLRGRIKFGQTKNPAPFPSAVVIHGNGSAEIKSVSDVSEIASINRELF